MKKQCPTIGGQAVMEGVMMKSTNAIGIAVRRPNGEIIVHHEHISNPTTSSKVLSLPIIRGIVNFALMMKEGTHILQKSAHMLGNEEQPTKLELWLSKKTGKNADKIMMFFATLFAIVFSIALFFVLPELFAVFLKRIGLSKFLVNLLSGFVRIGILLTYIYLISLVPDVKRTFMYHGAEHKTVFCFEHNQNLTPKNAQQFSRLHPRCGTSFILIVFVLSILLFTLVGYQGNNYLMRLASRLLLLPVVAGLSYELLKLLARSNSKVAKILRFPGLQLQKFTTKEPTEAMLECAIVAMNTALYGMPNFPKDEDGYAHILNFEDYQSSFNHDH